MNWFLPILVGIDRVTAGKFRNFNNNLYCVVGALSTYINNGKYNNGENSHGNNKDWIAGSANFSC